MNVGIVGAGAVLVYVYFSEMKNACPRLCESRADCHIRDSLNQGKVFFRVNTFPKLD